MKKILFLCCMLMVAVLYACPFSSEENGNVLTNRFIYISGVNAPDNHCSNFEFKIGEGSSSSNGVTVPIHTYYWQYTTKHPQNVAPPFTVYIAYASMQKEGDPPTDNELDKYEITLSIQISQNTTNWTTVTSRTFKNWLHPLFSKTGKPILGRYTVPASAFSPLGGNYYLRLRIVAKKLDEYGEVISYVDNTSYEDLTYYHKRERTGIWTFYNYIQTSEETYSFTTGNPVSGAWWGPADGDAEGAVNSFNPAQSVYLKITSARRPTHE